MAVQTTYSTAPDIGLPGQLADNGPNDVVTGINMEASAAMPFGAAVCFEGGTRDDGMLRPAAVEDLVAGIVLRSLAYEVDNLTNDAVNAGGVVNVLVKGRVYVTCEDGCAPGDRLHVRAVTAGAEVAGALLAAADGTDTIDCTTQGIWRTTAAAGALAVLEVDFTNAPPAAVAP